MPDKKIKTKKETKTQITKSKSRSKSPVKHVKKYKSGFIDTRGLNPFIDEAKYQFGKTGTNIQTAFNNTWKNPSHIVKEGQQMWERQEKINNSANRSYQKSFDLAGRELSSDLKYNTNEFGRQIVNAPRNVFNELGRIGRNITSPNARACRNGRLGCGVFIGGKFTIKQKKISENKKLNKKKSSKTL